MAAHSDKVQNLVNVISTQFDARTVTEGKKHGVNYGITLEVNIISKVLWLKFGKDAETHSVTIPLPYMENGIEFIRKNEVMRAVCPFWLEEEQRKVDYIAAIYAILLDVPRGFVSPEFIKATPYLQQMIYGFINGNASIVAYKLQKSINEVVNLMPLHETYMNSFVMNHRFIVIDDKFKEIMSPTGKLEYQVSKARKYFDRGWSTMGLADGTLADKNYILDFDIRKLSPFGIRFHNPQRNLYSTLGMKGDEYPIIRSQSMQELMTQGISRKGWNLFTAFVDVPDVFEDQILVDRSHCDKFVEQERRIQVFGDMKVGSGQEIKSGDVIGVAADGEPVRFEVIADRAWVMKVAKSTTCVGGVDEIVYNVVVKLRRYLRDGFKFTNLHGNKGIIQVADLGYATDPRTGKPRKIDVIVGAKTVGKRKNYGQVIEALFNNILEADRRMDGRDYARIKLGLEPSKKVRPVVIPDSWHQSTKEIKDGLERRGFARNGQWKCNTYAGKVKAVCGNVFWGCIKTPQDQLWKRNATVRRNGKEVRIAGLKFSHVEFRALETRLGKNSPVIDEIMSYAQGSENLIEELAMLRCKMGEYDKTKPVHDISVVKPLDQTFGTIVPRKNIVGTVVDEDFLPGGFLFKLPLSYQTIINEDGDVVREGSVIDSDKLSPEVAATVAKVYETDYLYFPSGLLRRCWRHDTGKYGLSELGVIINNVVTMAHRVVAGPNEPFNYQQYYGAIERFFRKISNVLCGKNGDISTLAMAVRYPFSAKATAALSNSLPKNVVEVHRSMAEDLMVKEGDIVVVERFPCLGFMSVRLQKVHITDDPMCEFVIRASGNSLVSTNLDFDGDNVYIASFHTPAAKLSLRKEWANPNRTCYEEITTLNNRKGAPHIKEYKLQDFNITPFADMTIDVHANIVEKNTGVKAQTGPVIAMTYNIMRIVEDSDLAKDQKMKVAIEMFLERAAQSVFEQKHGGKSLCDVVIDSACAADVEALVEVGFKRSTTEKLCGLIRQKAAAMGITNLRYFHEKIKESGGSNIISRIVKRNHRIYFASRSSVDGVELLEALSAPAVDVPSRMFKWIMAGRAEKTRTVLDKLLTEDRIKNAGLNADTQAACKELCHVVDTLLSPKADIRHSIGRALRESLRNILKGSYGYAQYRCRQV